MTEREKQRAIIDACCRDLDEARRMLKEHPDRMHCRDSVGENALHFLLIEGQVAASELFYGFGADIDTTDNYGTTPLMNTVMIDHRASV